MNHIKHNAPWLLAAVAITIVTLGVLFTPAAQASEATVPSKWGFSQATFTPDQRVFNEDLLVADGQVINDNVAVLNGSVTVNAGGVINGDLSVVRGKVEVAGQIRGDLAVVQGDAVLQSSARIEGNVSIVGGDVQRAQGAYVGGNFVRGSNQDWRGLIEENNGADATGAPQFRDRQNQGSWLALFFWRLVQAILWTLLITGLVVLIAWLAPTQVRRIARTAEAEPALSFAVGIVVSLVIIFLSVGLFATICLAPAGFLLSGLLAIAGLVGWAAAASWIGEKLAALGTDGAAAQIPSLVYVALATLVLTGLALFSWAILACLGFAVGLLLVSPGVGGVLVTLARRTGRFGSPPPAPTADESMASVASPMESDDTDVKDSNVEDEEPTGPIHTGDELGLTAAERTALQTGAGIAPSEAQGPIAADELPKQTKPNKPTEPADFTVLKGIGPTFNRRLHEAGIVTYAGLAALTAEEVSAIIGWPPERVVQDELREQAAALAARE